MIITKIVLGISSLLLVLSGLAYATSTTDSKAPPFVASDAPGNAAAAAGAIASSPSPVLTTPAVAPQKPHGTTTPVATTPSKTASVITPHDIPPATSTPAVATSTPAPARAKRVRNAKESRKVDPLSFSSLLPLLSSPEHGD